MDRSSPYFMGIDFMGIDLMGIDLMGIDFMGIDLMNASIDSGLGSRLRGPRAGRRLGRRR